MFFGESMFFRVPEASKTAFAVFAQKFFGAMGGAFIDSQVYTDHMARFGARNISRQAYLRLLRGAFSGEAPQALFESKMDWTEHFP